jgi:tetratricopeptide (TPR) repeat protein
VQTTKQDGQNRLFQKFLLLFLLLVCSHTALALSGEDLQTMKTLKQEATQHRLNGNYLEANQASDQLQRSFPNDGIGYTVSLNTLTTRLSWDGNDKTFDKTFRDDASTALDLCQARIKKNQDDYRGYYHCGQAYFALTYIHALRGNYFRSGTSGTKAIEHLEKTLTLNPGLTDAKMHLGVAYYYADNLPPFVKAFSKFFWFIPTGNSDKSLPYVKEVVMNGEYFKDVAKYLYADILIDGSENDRLMATTFLQELVETYPQNRRFALRHISLLVERELDLQALQAADVFIGSKDEYNRSSEDVYLARLWVSRAYMRLGSADKAIAEFVMIDQSSSLSSFPSWARSWFELTRAQIYDLQNERTNAVRSYHKVIRMHADYGSEEILSAAKEGVKTPYSLGH